MQSYLLQTHSKKTYMFFEKYGLDFQITIDIIIDALELIFSNFQGNISGDVLKTIISRLETVCKININNIISQQENILCTNKQDILDSITHLSTRLTTKPEENKLYSELTDFLNKYKNNSSVRGKIGENIIEHSLHSLFPSAEIINNSQSSSSCDFRIKRQGLTDILIEVKSYSKNVPKLEIDKFIKDIQLHNTHGIMISLHSGISNKNNFELESYNKNFVVYLHNVGNDIEKIKCAVDILDHIHQKLSQVSNKDYTISNNEIKEISFAYEQFIKSKMDILFNIKEFAAKLNTDINNLTNIPLERFLQTKMKSSDIKEQFICSICKIKCCKNKRSLNAHMISCKKKIIS